MESIDDLEKQVKHQINSHAKIVKVYDQIEQLIEQSKIYHEQILRKADERIQQIKREKEEKARYSSGRSRNSSEKINPINSCSTDGRDGKYQDSSSSSSRSSARKTANSLSSSRATSVQSPSRRRPPPPLNDDDDDDPKYSPDKSKSYGRKPTSHQKSASKKESDEDLPKIENNGCKPKLHTKSHVRRTHLASEEKPKLVDDSSKHTRKEEHAIQARNDKEKKDITKQLERSGSRVSNAKAKDGSKVETAHKTAQDVLVGKDGKQYEIQKVASNRRRFTPSVQPVKRPLYPK
ncbi:hypothetical protein TRFO_39347 [Tritrichomonas foetus]|uniref:Uncharacterized protein n=1 Tax=Tritrichomonas foetus TaxID=1144522 RepID=A0A1J4J9X2_9EUKA|nr:hypothetical protein TRFO_39347 [Tritrichomonas foetus]|eukprot:OHS94443.1 hypothetical protein TRFO_39347 [Tritrichomonas foetus]